MGDMKGTHMGNGFHLGQNRISDSCEQVTESLLYYPIAIH